MAGARVLLAAACAHAARAAVPAAYDVVEGDMLIPRARSARGLGHVSTDVSGLWPLGKVPFYIEDSKTNPNAPADYILTASDERILGAVAHIEEKTCLRFTQCTTRAECDNDSAVPGAGSYLYFISHASACNAIVGRNTFSSVGNEVNVARDCGYGTMIHEILHGMGIGHEQSRGDRDDYVFVDNSAIQPGALSQFEKSGDGSHDVGAYDFLSIMHYSSTAFAQGTAPTILSSEVLGQYDGMTQIDIDTIQFAYNKCQQATEPTCAVSRSSKVHKLALDKAWRVQFTGRGRVDGTLTVSYPTTGAPPQSMLQMSKPAGGSLAGFDSTEVFFTPTTGEAGNSYTIAATFTDDAGKSATCSVSVEVTDAKAICFDIPSTDPKVCSGRGTCTGEARQPCTCNAGYAGFQCEGFETCPANAVSSFDDKLDGWTALQGSVSRDNTFFVKQTSLKVAANSQAQLSLPLTIRPNWVSLRFAAATGATPQLLASSPTNEACFLVGLSSGKFFSGQSFGPTYKENQWYRIDFFFDYAANTYDVVIDGEKAITAESFGCPNERVAAVTFFGDGWLDEFAAWCTDYIRMDGHLALSQSKLRAGGETITYTLVGDYDTWIDSEENKQRVLDALLGDNPRTFDARKANLVNPTVVKVSADGKTLTVGPMLADAGYYFTQDTTLRWTPSGAMFTSGRTPKNGADSLTIKIPGECRSTYTNGYEADSDLPSTLGDVERSTALAASGSSSMRMAPLFRVTIVDLTGSQSTTAKMSLYVRDCSGNVASLDVGAFKLDIGSASISVNDVTFATCKENEWVQVAFTFSWTAKTATVTYGSGSPTSFMLGGDSLGQLSSSAFKEYFVDDIEFACPVVDPVYALNPACPEPATSAVSVKVHPGSEALSRTDEAVIVPAALADCTQAKSVCSDLGTCSSTSGRLSLDGTITLWSAGVLSRLTADAAYSVCYYVASSKRWVRLADAGSSATQFKTCTSGAPPATDAPTQAPTDAPTQAPTNAPTQAPPNAPTDAPTQAPPNAPTDAPTQAPPNAPTNAPTQAPPNAPTDAPTQAPTGTTDAPTQAPTVTTDAPTAAPTVPPTPSPPRDIVTEAPTPPPTPAPTPAPTPEPTTTVPTTGQPTTGEPTTGVPSTGQPTTGVPTTAEPSTGEPTTAEPSTGRPTTGMPTTGRPTTGEPTTGVPGTLTPTTTGRSAQALQTGGATVNPTTGRPTTGQPTTGNPTTGEPTTGVPNTARPSTGRPNTAAPTTGQPTTGEPTTGVPSTGRPTTGEPAAIRAVQDDDELHSGVVAGIVIGTVIFLGVAIGAVVLSKSNTAPPANKPTEPVA